MTPRIFLGWDAAEMRACNVAQTSARLRASGPLQIDQIVLQQVQAKGLYRRPMGYAERGYWDEISAAPMATGHAIARFLVPYLCGYAGWALFTDGDVLFRRDVADVFALADPTKAVQVVQHVHVPASAVKMTGMVQTSYVRKNWSSVMLFHCGHPANRALDLDLVNGVPGRDLHGFCWLEDAHIGALPPEWNVLVGSSDPALDPAIVHFTEGLPDMPGYEHCAYSDEWYAMAAHAGYRLTRPPKPALVSA